MATDSGRIQGQVQVCGWSPDLGLRRVQGEREVEKGAALSGLPLASAVIRDFYHGVITVILLVSLPVVGTGVVTVGLNWTLEKSIQLCAVKAKGVVYVPGPFPFLKVVPFRARSQLVLAPAGKLLTLTCVFIRLAEATLISVNR